MDDLLLKRTLLYVEPGPVVLITTNNGIKNNVMTISWTMPTSFSNTFAICTGPWNYSFQALVERTECVMAIPTVDMSETVVRIGDVSGENVDKFKMFNITPLKAQTVSAPLIKECLVNIECKITNYYKHEGIFILLGTKAWIDNSRKERRLFHALGDGTFTVDGEHFSHRELMQDKVPF